MNSRMATNQYQLRTILNTIYRLILLNYENRFNRCERKSWNLAANCEGAGIPGGRIRVNRHSERSSPRLEESLFGPGYR